MTGSEVTDEGATGFQLRRLKVSFHPEISMFRPRQWLMPISFHGPSGIPERLKGGHEEDIDRNG